MDIIRFSIENFRSFKDRQELKLSARTLIVTGQNNSGKSNVLRAAALIYNHFENNNLIQPLYDFFDQNPGAFRFSIFCSTEAPSIAKLRTRSAALDRCLQSITELEVPYRVDQSKTALDTTAFLGVLNAIIPDGQDTVISRDIAGSWSNRNHNMDALTGHLDVRKDLLFGTVYVPSFRHITQPGIALQSYNQMKLPGQTISPENIVTTLQAFDRPPIERLQEKEKLRRIEAFLSHCLEEAIGIEVASDRSAIYVSMGGVQRDLRALGTGIEQLLIIGTAAVGFENRIVLLEEPELHLHPRVQRRMLDHFITATTNRFVITTHSAPVVDSSDAEVIHIKHDGISSRVSSVLIRANMHQAIDDLGYRPSDLVQSNFILWVEGPSDRIYLNHWLGLAFPNFRESIDYTILFYGGRLLSHLAFSADQSRLIQVLEVNRHAAIVIDSDQRSKSTKLSSTKERIRAECEERGIFVWITQGREIENYISNTVLQKLQTRFTNIKAPASKYDKVLDADRTNKVEFANAAVELELDLKNLDLEQQILALGGRIKSVSA